MNDTPTNPIFKTLTTAVAEPQAPASEPVQAPQEAAIATPVQEAPVVSAKESNPTYAPVEPNFLLKFAYGSGEVPFDPDLPSLSYPAATREGTAEAMKSAPNFTPEEDRRLNLYATHIREGLNQLPMGNDMFEVIGRPGAKWTQAPTFGDIPLAGYVPKFKMREGGKYTGEAARNLVRSTLRMGTVFNIPLWHSGFWIALRAPSEGALLELHRQLTQDKILLGRATYGMIFSQATTYSTKAMADFVLEHFHSSSLKVDDTDSILNYIKTPDYQVLLWGMTCAMWPNGYQIQRACVSDVSKCTYVTTERVNLTRLLWTDESNLTQLQLQHMTNRQRQSVTVDQVKLYADQFTRGARTKVKISSEISMILQMPRLVDFIDAGYRWVNSIEEQYGRAMGMAEDERNKYLMSHAQAQAMCQYSHLVQAILVNDDEIDERADIVSILADLSSQDSIRSEFLKAVMKFQNESIISFIGIPNYKCPSCGGMQHPKAVEGQAHELIALDVGQTFFPLLMQKLSMIEDR